MAELSEMIYDRGLREWEIEPAYNATMEDLDLGKVRAVIARRSGSGRQSCRFKDIERTLIGMRCAVEVRGGTIVPTNVGILFFGQSPQDHIPQSEVQSKLRNPVLAGLLGNIPGYIEQIGSGIRFMLDETRRLELPAPQFREMSEFIVTFQQAPALRAPEPRTQYKGGTLWEEQEDLQPEIVVQDRRAEQVEKRLIQALQYVQEHGFITNGIYRQLTG